MDTWNSCCAGAHPEPTWRMALWDWLYTRTIRLSLAWMHSMNFAPANCFCLQLHSSISARQRTRTQLSTFWFHIHKNIHSKIKYYKVNTIIQQTGLFPRSPHTPLPNPSFLPASNNHSPDFYLSEMSHSLKWRLSRLHVILYIKYFLSAFKERSWCLLACHCLYCEVSLVALEWFSSYLPCMAFIGLLETLAWCLSLVLENFYIRFSSITLSNSFSSPALGFKYTS